MRIVLATQHAHRAFIPLALLYLKASVAGRGCCAADDVAILEFDPDTSAAAIADGLVAHRPDLIGLSCYVWNITTTIEAARLVRTRLPDVKLVLGGPEVGPIATEMLRAHPYVDVIVNSEGEVPFADIVEALVAGEPLDGVPGICFRNPDGEVVQTGAAPLVKSLDVYPSPHLERYIDYAGRIVSIETQRGCVFQCNFCFYNKDYSLRNRRFDLERVKQELLSVLDEDVEEIYLMDPVFNLNAARAKEICRFIAAHNRRRIPIHSEIWAEFVDDEMAALMSEAGFQFLEVGLQTTDPTALATTERRLRVERFNEGIAHLQRHNLSFELQLIYGLPGETRSTFRDSLNYAIALDPPVLSVFRLMVLPGTELWRRAAALELTFDPEPPYHARSHLSMTAEDLEYGYRFMKAANLLQRSRTLRLLAREREVSFASLVEEWLEWHPRQPESQPDTEILKSFVTHVCGRHRIPAPFYQHFGALEFAEPDALIRSATRTTSTMAATP
jgi:anaerobic magnesium-protoporphyrin IX monomethyl ester cyclase